MANRILKLAVADQLVEKFPNLTLKLVDIAIDETTDKDQSGDLHAIRRDLKALIAKGGAKE